MKRKSTIPVVPVRPQPVEDRRKAVVLLVTAIGVLTTMDMVTKYTSSMLPTPQIVWGRYIGQCLALIVITGPAGFLACVRSSVPGLHLLRVLFLFGGNFSIMAALRYLPLTEAQVIGFAAPLLLTGLAYPILGEHVSPRRWGAVAFGFVGVVIVLQPGTQMFHWAALLPLAMAVCAAFYHVLTPIVARVEDPAISIYYLGAVGAVVMSAAMPLIWVPVDALGWVLLMVIGTLGTIGHLMILRAFAHAPASMLAPIFYVQLIFAVGYGWLIFGDLPTMATIVGGALITASGLYVYRTQ